MALPRSSVFDNVDPRLVALIQQLNGKFGKYGVRATSGFRKGDTRFHGRDDIGRALDVELFDPSTGVALENYQDPANFAAYQQLANQLYNSADPELQKLLRWGGYFSGDKGKYGALDLMHFDVAGDLAPMGGGSWAGGLTPEQAKIWGLSTGGGVGAGDGQFGPAMPKSITNYSPEDRRRAIASIESAGSGDYRALGPVVRRRNASGPNATDRAYGKYQVMGSNIPEWTKQVLGRSMTPDEFLANDKAQDAVFDKIFGDYVTKHGEEGAASMWFTGRPDAFTAKDILGTSGGEYIKKYMAALTGGGATGQQYNYPEQAAPAVAGTGPSPDQGGKKEDFGLKDFFGEAGDSFAGMFGGGKQQGRQQSQLASSLMPASMVRGEGVSSSSALSPEAADARLQLALQRLNSRRLF